MPKGLFSQGVCLLLSRPVTVDELEPLLTDFKIAAHSEPAESKEIAGPGLIISYRPEVNGAVAIDLQDSPWPDHMGDPQREGILFGAWMMGHYGQFVFPGNLERAVEQAWSWKEAGDVADKHQAFVRIKSTYVFGAGKDAPILRRIIMRARNWNSS